MAAAKEALEVLSREPSAQRMAQYREDAAIERRLDRAVDRQEGRAEGRRAMMRELLEARFGALSPDLARRIDEASESDLAAWIGRVVSAPTLADVFGHE